MTMAIGYNMWQILMVLLNIRKISKTIESWLSLRREKNLTSQRLLKEFPGKN